MNELKKNISADGEIYLCRKGCGACCIALSISSPIPGMKNGKSAGTPCIHLTADKTCGIFNNPERPRVCSGLRPSEDMCHTTFAEAYAYLEDLENKTNPKGACFLTPNRKKD
jgi:Fe-S-cluster containining protein